MDETVDVPDPAAIRRALAECMTLADIDDAMGWASGTARRRRWRDRAAGGLPPVDAELAGVPLWFRTTITRWQAEQLGTDAGHPDDVAGDRRPAPPEEVATPAAVEEPAAHEEPPSADRDEDGEEAPDDAGAAGEEEEEEEDRDDGSDDDGGPDEARPTPPAREPDVPDAEPAAPGAQRGTELATGFQVEPDQEVLAFVHGAWKRAVVRVRDRRTVVVDYQLDPGPLGARRQRVTLDRIRLPSPES